MAEINDDKSGSDLNDINDCLSPLVREAETFVFKTGKTAGQMSAFGIPEATSIWNNCIRVSAIDGINCWPPATATALSKLNALPERIQRAADSHSPLALNYSKFERTDCGWPTSRQMATSPLGLIEDLGRLAPQTKELLKEAMIDLLKSEDVKQAARDLLMDLLLDTTKDTSK